MPILAVNKHGLLSPEALEAYAALRTAEVARRLRISLCDPVRDWYDNLSVEELYDHEGKYLGEASGEAQTVAAVEKAKAAQDAGDIVTAVEEVILNFCGFQNIKAKYFANALHFQYEMFVDGLSRTNLTPLADKEAPSDEDKAWFDNTKIVSAEALLRVIVETKDGLVANPCSPGQPMGKLCKLPLFAQFILVLINAVEAVWYQSEIPDCPIAINLYASLLVDKAPLQQMVEGVRHVEIMEMTKGAKRSQAVVDAVKQIREEFKCFVLLDDFDAMHPGLDSVADAIKVSVFGNAFHALQVVKEGGVPAQMPFMDKEKTNDKDFKDYYCSLVPNTQPEIKMVVFEGGENCVKSEVSPGPPLNYGEPKATVASLHLCQAAARALLAMNPKIRFCRQGGRALYANEEFDQEASMVLAKLGKNMQAARTTDVGTFGWMGQEGVRRAAMSVRSRACGVTKADVPPADLPVVVEASFPTKAPSAPSAMELNSIHQREVNT